MKHLLKFMGSMVMVFSFTTLYAQNEQPMIGQMAPTFELKDLAGETYSLKQLRNMYLVLHFAATWCPFCNAEAPNLEQLYKSYKDKGVLVIIIDVKEDKSLVEKSVKRFDISFPVLLDGDGVVSAKYAPETVQPALARHEVPIASNLIIDKEGMIRFYSLLNTANFDASLAELKQKLDEILINGK